MTSICTKRAALCSPPPMTRHPISDDFPHCPLRSAVGSPPRKRRRILDHERSLHGQNNARNSGDITGLATTMDVDMISPDPMMNAQMYDTCLDANDDIEIWVAQRLLGSDAVMSTLNTPQLRVAFTDFLSRSTAPNRFNGFCGGGSLTHKSLMRHFGEWGVSLSSEAKTDMLEILYTGNLRRGA